jgi:hypothetical protein
MFGRQHYLYLKKGKTRILSVKFDYPVGLKKENLKNSKAFRVTPGGAESK